MRKITGCKGREGREEGREGALTGKRRQKLARLHLGRW